MSNQFSTYFDKEEVITMTPFESIFPFTSRLIGSPTQARDIIGFLRQETSDIRQIMLFALIGYGVPFLGSSVSNKVLKMDQKTYQKTKTFHILNHISQGFKIGAFSTFIETISELILGLDSAITVLMTNTISSIMFSIWGMYRVKVLKNFAVNYFCKRMNLKNKRLERFYKTASDYLLYIITGIVALDTLGFKYQTALKSISVFGGVGTIIFSLASKDMSTQLLSGMSIKTTQQFAEGDELLLESNTLVTVEKVGFLHTYVRGHDEIIMKISNAELEQMRISNLSLSTTSQVKQELRFDYSSIDNMGNIVKEIKKEIKESSDVAITDGSRPFRVHWTSFGEEWLEVTVDCRLRVAPMTDDYHRSRQEILFAIARAAKKCNARFAEDLS